MKLHIVGGFLGSGKTTAITNAAKMLMERGKKTGVITNDQGKYLVDTGFVDANHIPSEEVINGCFCCNFDSLSEKIEHLNQVAQPEYIFAESVGSCTDLVATVVKPLLIFKKNIFESLTFSIFVDARLLLSYLKGDKLLFSDDIIYIFGKQIEEADLLIVNKIDLVLETDLKDLKKLVDTKLSRKIILVQNSLDPQNIDNWLDTLENLPPRKRDSLEIDYQSYGKGEADLAWLDEEINFTSLKHEAGETAARFIENVVTEIQQKQIPVGHLKFLLFNGDQVQKISFTSIIEDDWKKALSPVSSNLIKLMVNARIETSPDTARSIIHNAITAVSNNGVTVSESNEVSFQPGFPTPTHRITKAMPCCDECVCIKKLLARNALRLEDGSEAALSELEDEQFECLCDSGAGDGCCC
jgi:G3E family GTPase